MEVSLVTYNIYKHEDFDQRLPVILDVLRGVRADIACLQEVPPEAGRAESIARALGHRFAAATVFVRPDDGWSEGLAILSNWPIVETEPVELRPGVPNCLRVAVETPGGRVDVYNTHLHPRDSDLRQREASLILERMARDPARPALVAGDFNAVPGGRTMAVVWPHLRSAYEIARGSHPETTFPTPLRPLAGRQPGFSERREAPPTEDESQAKAAIDYVLVRPGQFRALESRVIGAEPQDGVWASDHYGVYVRLEMV